MRRYRPWAGRSAVVLLALLFPLESGARAATEPEPKSDRPASLRAICQRLNIAPGAVVADIGCGDGPDSVVFASLVGAAGTVLAEEIDANKLEKVLERSQKDGYSQVVPILGQGDDPRLPNGCVDLAYMRYVFHHFAQPGAMLRHLWFDLKPGGFLVIVDRQKGPLKDRVAQETRQKEHHWTGETAVVRLAREEGFLFFDVLDELWHEKDPFVLVFRRPSGQEAPKGDPDVPRSWDEKGFLQSLPLPESKTAHVLFFGLDQGRNLLPLLRQKLDASVSLDDVVLEEWPITKEEVPSMSNLEGVTMRRIENGQLQIPEDAAPGLVIFADSFHRLWQPVPLLETCRQRMQGQGWLVVMDRSGPADESRRQAGHHRRISPRLVREELEAAGFEWVRELTPPGADRFASLFRPVRE